jgi:hypothetical protein
VGKIKNDKKVHISGKLGAKPGEKRLAIKSHGAGWHLRKLKPKK